MSQENNPKKYRFDFALITITGNITRYRILRPLVERDATVAPRWFPIRTWYAEDPLRFLPGALRLRLRHLLDTWKLFLPSQSDAILIHAFETYYLYVIAQRLMGRRVAIITNPDGHLPVSGRSGLLGQGKFRCAISQTDLYIFWSRFCMEQSKELYPDLPAERVLVFHPGIDLMQWPVRPLKKPEGRFKILFVGGDLLRKGADTLLDAFEQGLSETSELHIATQSGYLPPDLKARIENHPHIVLHLDVPGGSDAIKALYRQSDVFVLPTNLDGSPWVSIEALATGIPTIITPIGGIPDIVMDGETGLIVPVKDPQAIIGAVNRLREDKKLRERLSRQGRAHIEAHFDAECNTQRLLSIMKEAADRKQNRTKKRANA